MVAKKWLIGCGAFAAVGAILLVLAGAFVANRAGQFMRQVETASDRYTAINADFPFTKPESGVIAPERFKQYLVVRRAVNIAITPMKETAGPLDALRALSTVPDDVSRAHVDALREQSMSLDEYRWISRQLYTTAAAERYRSDPDERLITMDREFRRALRSDGTIQVRTGTSPSNRESIDTELLDFTWLRVPDSTRNLILSNLSELSGTENAIAADAILLNFQFNR